MKTTYQIYNDSTLQLLYETQSEESLAWWLKLNTVHFLAADYGYFPCNGKNYTVIDKENDRNVTE